jgi:hypothetical protein
MKTNALLSLALLLAGGCASTVEDESTSGVALPQTDVSTMADTLRDEFALSGDVFDRACIPSSVMTAKTDGPMRIDDGMLPYGGIQAFLSPGVRLALECRRAPFTRVQLLAATEPVRVRELATSPRIDESDWCYDANRRAIHFRSEVLHSGGEPLRPDQALAITYVAAPYQDGDPYDCPKP